MEAILGVPALGNFKLGEVSAALVLTRATKVRVLLDGVDARTLVAALSIRGILNEAPDTCALTFAGTEAPTDGQELRITLGVDEQRLLFAGTVQTTDQTYQLKPANGLWPCRGIDRTARLNRRRPLGTWTLTSATTIAQYLVTTYAPTFTTTHIASSLAAVTITFDGAEDFSACLARLATLIGGYSKVEDNDVYLFLTDTADAPDAVDTTNPPELDPPITCSTDDSQLITKCYGKGHGEKVPVDVLAGETIVPVEDAVMFNPIGGQAVAGTTPDGAQSQKLTYTGVVLGGAGAVVGTGATPSVAPSVAAAPGAGLTAGVYRHAYTDVTASGESLPSPLSTVTVGAVIANPGVAPNGTYYNGSPSPWPFATGDAIRYWAYTWVTATGETLPSPTFAPAIAYPLSAGGPYAFGVTSLPVGPAGVTSRKLYRTAQGSAQLKLVATIADNTTTALNDNTTDAALGANAPTSSTATAGNQVSVSAIAIGASPTTSRKLYRTVVGGSQLKLLTTIADNTTTTYTDSTADGSLGANAPTSDASGLTQPYGQVNAGSTSVVTAGTGTLPSSGWILTLAGDLVRYTGITGNTLTGIPASGSGAILTTMFYGDPIVPAPALTGVSGVALAIQKGTVVHLWVERNDLTAQSAAAARESTATFTSDGVHEFLVTDERRGEASLAAVCDAYLARFSYPIPTYRYATRDVKTKSGKTVHINLPGYPVGDYVIQTVDVSEIDVAPGTPPKFTVTAASVAFSLDAVLRQLIGQGAV